MIAVGVVVLDVIGILRVEVLVTHAQIMAAAVEGSGAAARMTAAGA